jgi:hypothetical protein
MRQVFTDFMKLERRADGTVRIMLGAEQVTPDLAGLTDGERVRLTYPGELQADATVQREEHNGLTVWYAVVPSMDDIQDIHPDTLADVSYPEASKPTATGA